MLCRWQKQKENFLKTKKNQFNFKILIIFVIFRHVIMSSHEAQLQGFHQVHDKATVNVVLLGQ